MSFFNRLLSPFRRSSIDPAIQSYLCNTYPSNHAYKIHGKSLTPTRKLAKRFKSLSPLYPTTLTSFLDLGSCKGYFVFEAAAHPSCTRSVGIDIHEPDLAICNRIKDYLHADNVTFANLMLHELADRIDEFGGPFQVVMLTNIYQYLYFGSARNASNYMSHDTIFKSLATICSDRVIFNNRTDLKDCQNREQVNQSQAIEDEYSTQAIRDAASRYFDIEDKGTYGRFPLWVLRKK